ncbi:hypothetical protein MTR67_037940 [Solanum verrucosum]|uniref:Aminotransferase-like plant mobile domain-containing protein n=1 Tax=Solanum verrucosum TaxID=315347 RepID=A0AAF0ZP50_SOLVR|nr:hypothetical protein MTR67_037940 [Solanum verrucosum]
MAKDKVASLGAEVSQSKEKMAKKMQELNKELIPDKIFVPIPGSSSNFILGPCFKTMFPPELSSLYPLAVGEKLLLHSVQLDWFGGKYLDSWPSNSRSWNDWVDRVEKAKGEVWKSADIYDAIQLSKNDISMDKNLLYAALCYWSISTNSFHFRFGMMGPTVLDIVALTGLRPHGEEVSAILGMAGSTCHFPKYGTIYDNSLRYSKYLDVSKSETAVTKEEHLSFLFTWLSKHLFCDSSVNMIKQCTKLAFALAAGRKLALAPFLLSNLYHGCTEIIMGKFLYGRGPFWILQFWLQSYFPEFQPATLDTCNIPTYASFEEYFRFFHKCASRTISQFTLFSSRKFGPVWFKKSLDPDFQKLNKPELQDIWASYLIARDLPYSILLDESLKCKYEVEHYSPNQFARQFGMTQAVPFHQSANKLPIRRKDFQSADYTEETESRFCQLKRKFSLVPFDTNPSSTEFFDSWWSTYIHTRDKTAVDILRKISPHVMPLCSSDRQKIAAPQYNGIKGNSESAGKIGQNMKRKYEGDNIPSQSLAQQDEPIQQKNLNEAAENIATTTLCKKTKTYSRKFSPGTTSAIPSTSAFPTSCTPANEDRTEADIQVSTVTPISASDKNVEECTVSPSLDNTRSKTSDISQPPDCPSKFDNLEGFFARVSGKIKCAQSLGFTADRSSPIDDKKSATLKSKPSAEMLATAKGDIKRLLLIPSQVMLLPGNCSALSAALSVHTGAPDLSAERALALEKLKENLPHFSLTLRRAKKDQEEYYKKVSKQELLIDELTKDQELYTNLKDGNNRLDNKISKLEARLKAAKTKSEAIKKQQLSLANKCSGKCNALDEMEAEFPVLKEMKELADWDIARLEESLRDFKSKIIE